MSRSSYQAALKAMRHTVARQITTRSVLGKPLSVDLHAQLLTIGLLLTHATLYTPGERAEIHQFLLNHYV